MELRVVHCLAASSSQEVFLGGDNELVNYGGGDQRHCEEEGTIAQESSGCHGATSDPDPATIVG